MKKIDVSKKIKKTSGTGERRGGGKQKLDCYKKCVDDAWDLKPESMCSSVCGF